MREPMDSKEAEPTDSVVISSYATEQSSISPTVAEDYEKADAQQVQSRWVLPLSWLAFALVLLNPAITYLVYEIGSVIGGDFFRYSCGLRTTVVTLPIIAILAMFLVMPAVVKHHETAHPRLVIAISVMVYTLGLLELLTSAYLSPLLNMFGRTTC